MEGKEDSRLGSPAGVALSRIYLCQTGTVLPVLHPPFDQPGAESDPEAPVPRLPTHQRGLLQFLTQHLELQNQRFFPESITTA